jgi:hypothetical protein
MIADEAELDLFIQLGAIILAAAGWQYVVLLTFGEGWHNNHRAHPQAARHGPAWYELDLNWYGISALRSHWPCLGRKGTEAQLWRRQESSDSTRACRLRLTRHSLSGYLQVCRQQ